MTWLLSLWRHQQVVDVADRLLGADVRVQQLLRRMYPDFQVDHCDTRYRFERRTDAFRLRCCGRRKLTFEVYRFETDTRLESMGFDQRLRRGKRYARCYVCATCGDAKRVAR